MAKKFTLSAVILVLNVYILASAKCQLPNVIGTTRNFKPAEEKTALDKIRPTVEKYLYEDYMRTDRYLLRWLRDQHLDVGLTREKLINHMKWRKQNSVDRITSEDFSDIARQCSYDISGHDRNGRPFLTSSLGECHLRRIVLSGKIDRLNRAVFHLLESMSAVGRTIEKNLTHSDSLVHWTIIADMSGLSAREHMCLNCFPFFLTMMDVYVNHYPQLFKDIFVINANRVTVTLIDALRALAPINHEESLYAYGYDKGEWQRELLRRIKPNQLTPAFGGDKPVRKS